MRLHSRIRFYQSHIAIRVIGWALLCAGIYVVLQALVANEWVLMLFGHLFAIVGLGVAFGGTRIELDIEQKRLIRRRGLLHGFKHENYALNAVKAVKIAKSYHRTDNSHYVVYAVSLQGLPTSIYIGEYGNYAKARRLAENIAKKLNTNLVDASSRKTRTRPIETIDQPLQMQLLRAKNLMRKPQLMAVGRWQASEDDQLAMLTLLPQKFSFRNGIIFVAATSVAWFVCTLLFPTLDAVSPLFSPTVSLLFGLTTVLPDIAAVEEILLSQAYIDHRRRIFNFYWTRYISIGDVEELTEGNNGSIVLRGDTQALSIGNGMTAEEKRWIAAYLRYWITHRAGLVA